MSDGPKQGPATGRPGLPFDAKALWKEVQENSDKLKACVGPHIFREEEPGKLGTKSECTRCGGSIHHSNVYWYKQGLRHGRRS